MKTSIHKLIMCYSIFLALLAGCMTSVAEPQTESDKVFAIPSSPQVPPNDVLDQIAVFGGGGEKEPPDCLKIETPCIKTTDEGIFIRGERPNQRVSVLAYKCIDDGYDLCNYYTEWTVELNADSTFSAKVENIKKATIFVVYDAETRNLVASNALFDNAEDAKKLMAESQCPSNTEIRLCKNCGGRIINDQVRGNGLPNGTLFYVINGPKCAADSIQWYVEIQEGQFPVVTMQENEFWQITLNGETFLRATGHTWIFEKFNGKLLAEKLP